MDKYEAICLVDLAAAQQDAKDRYVETRRGMEEIDRMELRVDGSWVSIKPSELNGWFRYSMPCGTEDMLYYKMDDGG